MKEPGHFSDHVAEFRLRGLDYAVHSVSMVGKTVKFREVGSIIVSKDKIALSILKMVSTARMSSLSPLYYYRLAYLEQMPHFKSESVASSSDDYPR